MLSIVLFNMFNIAGKNIKDLTYPQTYNTGEIQVCFITPFNFVYVQCLLLFNVGRYSAVLLLCACVYVVVCMCIHVCLHIYIYIYIYMYIFIYLYIYIYTFIYIYIYVCMCACACMCLYVYLTINLNNSFLMTAFASLMTLIFFSHDKIYKWRPKLRGIRNLCLWNLNSNFKKLFMVEFNFFYLKLFVWNCNN